MYMWRVLDAVKATGDPAVPILAETGTESAWADKYMMAIVGRWLVALEMIDEPLIIVYVCYCKNELSVNGLPWL